MFRFLTVFLFLAAPLAAQNSVEQTFEAVARIDAATHALSVAEDAEDKITALTEAVRAYEAGLAALRESERRTQLARTAAANRFEEESEEVSRLLAALQAAGAPTTPTRLLHPSGPLGSARAAILMADVLPGLQGAAFDTQTRMEEFLAIESALESASEALEKGATGAREARLALAAALRARRQANTATMDVALELAQSARSLEELALVLVETPGTDDLWDMGPFENQIGSLRLPVEGALLHGFDENSDRPGLEIATLPGALVSIPLSSTVRFAGVLEAYGNVVILELGPGYHLIVAGVHETAVSAGQVLPPDAALGLMGGTEESSGTSQFDRGQTLTQTLYVEARANGDLIDPATWFALDKEQ